MSEPSRTPCVLSIAGSDSGGGAGIQADLKAFARCGVHGTTAVTAVTAQNTVAVTDVFELPREIIVAQVRAVAEDIGVDAVKIGMLGTAAIIDAVAEALDLVGDAPIVVDPVMVAESGARLLAVEAIDALREKILPRATIATPNVDEAAALVGGDPSVRDPESLAQAVYELGPQNVIVTGGDRESGNDLFFDGSDCVAIAGERFETQAAHGSGCTHSSIAAAQLALGLAPLEAARKARELAGTAVRHGLEGVGRGAGPVDVLADVCPKSSRASLKPPFEPR